MKRDWFISDVKVINEQAIVDDASRQAEEGDNVGVHYHAHKQQCTGACYRLHKNSEGSIVRHQHGSTHFSV